MFSLNHEAQIVQEIVEEQFEPKDNDMPDLVEIKSPKKKKFAAKFGINKILKGVSHLKFFAWMDRMHGKLYGYFSKNILE